MDSNLSDTTPPDVAGDFKSRLVVVGATARALVSGPEGFGNYAEIVREYADLDDWRANAVPTDADLLVVHCPTLFPDTAEWIQHRIDVTGATRAIVLYEFAQAATVHMVEKSDSHITALRAPVTPAALKEACEADIALASMRQQWSGEPVATETKSAPASAEAGVSENVDSVAGATPSAGGGEADPMAIPARQFTDEQLSKLSLISTAVDCECPHHLSALLVSLNAFEEYSARCENRNDEDAVLHAYLHGSTARARVIMEDALSVLAEAEGFDLG